MAYQHIKIPAGGEKIRVNQDFSLSVPDNPVIPYIEGDGTGLDITPVMLKVVDAAVNKAYGGKKKIVWMEMYAGEKSCRIYGENVWLPEETLQAAKEFVVSIKGPLTTPVGGGIRSINVALRQELDLYVCLRPVRWFTGVPSPIKRAQDVDMVIFRENSEDIYAGIEWPANSPEAKKVIDFLIKEMKVKKIRFPNTSAIGIKPISIEGSERLIRKAYQYAIDNKRKNVTLVHKGNIQKFTEGGFRDWGYQLAVKELGGIGIAPGANMSDTVAMFEATHGTAPKYAGKDYVNPGSEILSAEMMLRHMGWTQAADLIISSMEKSILSKKVTYDFARLMEGATQVSCSGFGQVMIDNM